MQPLHSPRAQGCAFYNTMRPCPPDLAIRGTLHSVDQYLNVKLLNVSVDDAENFPHMVRRPGLFCSAPRTLPPRPVGPNSLMPLRTDYTFSLARLQSLRAGLAPPRVPSPGCHCPTGALSQPGSQEKPNAHPWTLDAAAIGQELLCPRVCHQICAATSL